MDTHHLLAFNLALLVAIASPGPALLVAIRTNLGAGRRSGLAVGYGLGLMAATWTLMAILGLDWIFKVVPWLYAVVKIAGAGYLLYVAWNMWRGARSPVDVTAQKTQHAFWSGLLVNLLNPKAVLFSAAVLIVIFPGKLSLTDGAILVINHMLVEWGFYTVLAFILSTKAISTRYLQAKVYIDRFAAVVLGGLGARLLFVR